MIKPLIGVPSPRDLESVMSELHKIPVDKYFVKYHYEHDAYRKIREYFLEHKEYTHLIISPDDLVFKREHYEALLVDIEQSDYSVISGICNIDFTLPLRYAVGVNIKPEYAFMNFFTEKEVNELPPIKQVTFAGFPATWVRRDIVERLSFTGMDGGWANKGCSFDTKFAVELFDQNIPQFVDCRVNMQHLSSPSLAQQNVGRRKPYEYFQKYG